MFSFYSPRIFGRHLTIVHALLPDESSPSRLVDVALSLLWLVSTSSASSLPMDSSLALSSLPPTILRSSLQQNFNYLFKIVMFGDIERGPSTIILTVQVCTTVQE